MGGDSPLPFCLVLNTQKSPQVPMTRTGHGAKPQQVRDRVLDLLLTGKSAKAIAGDLNINEKTVDRLLRDGDFRSELLARSRAISDSTMANLIAANTAAVGKMIELMGSEDPAISLRACRAVLDISQKWLSSDVEERLRKLEETLNEIAPNA